MLSQLELYDENLPLEMLQHLTKSGEWFNLAFTPIKPHEDDKIEVGVVFTPIIVPRG